MHVKGPDFLRSWIFIADSRIHRAVHKIRKTPAEPLAAASPAQQKQQSPSPGSSSPPPASPRIEVRSAGTSAAPRPPAARFLRTRTRSVTSVVGVDQRERLGRVRARDVDVDAAAPADLRVQDAQPGADEAQQGGPPGCAGA